MKIKKFIQFINEELVIGKDGKPFNLDDRTNNFFVKVFNSDTLAVKEFIQKNIGRKNLRFLGGGGIGLAFMGEDGRVIKFTADESEKKGVERLIELAPNDEILPGFAKYFWIKEVDLPEGNKSKSPNIWLDEKTQQHDKNKIGEFREIEGILRSKDLDPKRRFELEQRLKRLKKHDQDFTDRRKQNPKKTKAYIICLEKLRLLNKIESEIVHNIFLFMGVNYLIPGDIDNYRKLNEFFNWLQSDNEVFTESKFIKGGFDKINIVSRRPGLTKSNFYGTNEDYKRMWREEITKSYFSKFSSKVLELYSRAKILGIPSKDIHEGNVGFRGDELVAFDCM